MSIDSGEAIATALQVHILAPDEFVPPGPAGIYAWWVREGHLEEATPRVPKVRPENTAPPWSLLYVGIGPKRAGPRTLGERLRKDHGGSSIGSSTFRQSLAALLIDHLELTPKPGYDRSRLVTEAPLSEWIRANAGLSAVAVERPWDHEDEVIRHLNPPLNLRPGFHPFRHEVDGARKDLRRACGLLS